jgi:hypothetical protein
MVEGLEIGASTASRVLRVPFGVRRRAASGVMRSHKLGDHRAGTVVTDFMDGDLAEIVRVILSSPGPLLMSGALLGEPTGYFVVVGAIETTPLGANLFALTFRIEERDFSSALLFSFDGDAPGPYTHTRSGTAYYVDADGVLQQAADGVARFTYLDLDGVRETRAYLGEPARTNQSATALTSLVLTNSATWTGTTTGPDGAVDSGKGIAHASGSVTISAQYAITATDDEPQVFRIYAKAGDADWCYLRFNTKAAGLADVYFDLANGVVGSDDVIVTGYIDPLGDGWYEIVSVCSDIDSGGSSPLALFGPAQADGDLTMAGAGAPYTYFAFPSVEADTSVWSSALDLSQTRNADLLYGAFPHAPSVFASGGVTFYLRFVERGTYLTASGHLLKIGSATAGADPRIAIRQNSNRYGITHDDGVSPQTATLGVGPTFGLPHEIRAVVNTDGSVLIGQSINGATETVTAASSAVPFTAAWAAERLYIGSDGTSGHGLNPIIAVKVVRGVYTMDEMRDFARGRLYARVA